MNIAYASEGISIHLNAPILGHFFGVPLTSTMVMSWLTMAVLFVFAFLLRRKLAIIPRRTQLVVEAVVGGAYEYVRDTFENEDLTRRFFPLIMTIFVFILSLNWLGLLPGVDSIGIFHESHGESTLVPFLHPANTDLNITIALAIIAFVAIEFAGIFYLGVIKYGKKFINFSSPLAFLIGIIELFSELARLVSFSFRLFGNIFAGKTLILITIFFVPYIVPIPFLAFELFVGFIQAFIFAVLTLFFIKLATSEPH